MSTAVVVQDSTESVPLGAVAGYGESSENSVNGSTPEVTFGESTSRQVTPTKVYPSGTTSSLASQSTSSLGGAKPIPTNRQNDFEKLFGNQLQPPKGEDTPDFYTVCQTQSADLQASVLLHGRLYLTRYHLCFRSNICGYVTEKIHDLRDIVSVERSTTAKWIQNAISLTLDTESDEKVVGYGSMGDREAMYAGVMELWKLRAPDRYSTFMDRREVNSDGEESAEVADVIGGTPNYSKSKRHRSATSATQSGTKRDTEIEGRHRSATATGDLGHGVDGTPKAVHKDIAEETEEETAEGTNAAQTTECSGQHYDELALDTTLPVKMDQLYNLMYHTPEFGKDWLENKQKLTDVQVGDWEDKGGVKERSLTYVMHMNNYIGPKKSDCIGSERVELADPAKAYEIVSETQTPDVPSGKSFKIHTRTCLTRAVDDGAPATRMYCTTQCDWSASSMLKSTITPAVIKGQKEYHQKWLSALKEWIDAHPTDFESESDDSNTTETDTARPVAVAAVPVKKEVDVPVSNGSSEKPRASVDTKVVEESTVADQIVNMVDSQIMLTIMIVCAMSLALNVYLLTK